MTFEDAAAKPDSASEIEVAELWKRLPRKRFCCLRESGPPARRATVTCADANRRHGVLIARGRTPTFAAALYECCRG